MKQFKVSVIVPVYNVEAYLDRCLNSLAMQTLENLEVIVVNDGTQDNSQTIIDAYVKKYPQSFKSFIKPNGGLADARNFGLNHAKGEFIGFIDSDDYIEHEMYHKMYTHALTHQADLVICDVLYEWEYEQRRLYVHGIKPTKLNRTSDDIQKRAFLSPLFAWNKLYHHKLFEELELTYPVSMWYEDIPVSLPMFAHANRIAYLNEALVYYTQRDASIMSQVDHVKSRDIFRILDMVLKYFVRKNLFSKYQAELEYVFIEQLILYGGFRFLRAKDKSLMLDALSMIKHYFPHWKRNQYIHELKLTHQLYLYVFNRLSIPIFRFLVS